MAAEYEEPVTAATDKGADSRETALVRFIREAHQLFAREPEPAKRWSLLSPILSGLLTDKDVMEASKRWPDCVFRDGRAENLLFYEDVEFGFTVNGLTKGAARQGVRPLIHDHAHIYTLYGVLDGHERIENYRRIDDRSVPDRAEIVRTEDVFVGPGEISLVRPYEIHTEVTVGERTAAVIVRSEKQGTFNQGRYDPDTNRYWESLGPRLTPCDILAPTNG